MIGRRLGRWAHDLEALALPQRCPGCGVDTDPAHLLCERCRAAIPLLRLGLCVRCLAAEREPAGCTRHPGFQVWAAWVYDERAALVVQALKYGERPALAGALGQVIAAALPPSDAPDLILAVPLHPARARERGYNQAGLLAEAVARARGVPRLERGLQRVRPTQAQARLGPVQRRRNVSGAFRVLDPDRLRGRRVLVVDDVLTTGSTLEACLEALRAAGAEARGAALAWAQ
jgi:ComF family protein